MLNKSCPCWPPALPAALPAWHRAKPLNKGGLEAEHTLTPWWISLDRAQRGASPTPPRQSLGWQRWQHVALTHQGSCSDGVTLSCLDPWRPQDTTPAIFPVTADVCRRPPGHGLQPSRVSEMRHGAEGLLPAVGGRRWRESHDMRAWKKGLTPGYRFFASFDGNH